MNIFTGKNKAESDLKAKGGTELQYQALLRHVPADLLGKVHVSVSAAVGGARHLKPHIFWAHQSYDQPSVQNLKDPQVQASIDVFVFVSRWQRDGYMKHLGIPPERSVVIPNAIEPFPTYNRGNFAKLRLIYTSTPFRGLDVLLDTFAELQRDDVELHIFSGMSLYGRPEEDAKFAHLYEQAKALPNVVYHGVQPNHVVRAELCKSNLFVYPSTWEETSCLSLIEAMTSGCLPVFPKLGALPETAHDFGIQYEYSANKNEHIKRFSDALMHAIDSYSAKATQQQLQEQTTFFNTNYAWSERVYDWEQLINQLTQKYERTTV